ncbi:MAG: choline kinase [Candidatus Latescibacterota bacterium]
MKGLIIAAGKGSRIASIGSSKPLIPLLDIPLIEWVIQTAYQGGIDEFYVVIGYNGDRVHSFLKQLSHRLKIPITPLLNEEWGKANGISVLKARESLTEPFVLCMADHIFEAEIITALSQLPLENGTVKLAVDYGLETSRLVDQSDVTKVLVDEGKIIDIGKDISRFNAYDTGLFYCSPVLFEAIEASIADHGDDTLSGAMRVLGQRGKAYPVDVGTHVWLDIDTVQNLRKAEELILSGQLKKFV